MPLGYLPKKLMDEVDDWSMTGLVSSTMQSLQEQAAPLFRPVQDLLPQAPPMPEVRMPEVTIPEVPKFDLGRPEDWMPWASEKEPQPVTAQSGHFELPDDQALLGPSAPARPAGGTSQAMPTGQPTSSAADPDSIRALPRPTIDTKQGGDAVLAQLAPSFLAVERGGGPSARNLGALVLAENGGGQSTLSAVDNNWFSISHVPGRKFQAGPGTGGRFARYASPQDSLADFVDLISTAPRYKEAWALRNAPPEQFFGALARAGYIVPEPGFPVETWLRNTAQGAARFDRAAANVQPAPAPSSVTQQASETRTASGERALAGITPPQFGLGDADAEAICGPVLAMAFAQANGRPATIAEAKQMATQHGGWTRAQGMGGPYKMAETLVAMGIHATYKPGELDVETIRRETANGNPVGINTRGHYFVVEGVDALGRLDLGNSAKALTASKGRQWFLPSEIASLGMGAPTGAIYKDNPATPVPSVAVSQSAPMPHPAAVAQAAEVQAAVPVVPPTTAPPARDDWRQGQASELDAARASTGGGDLLLKDGGTAPPARDDWRVEPPPIAPDLGPREAIPGSVGASPAVYDPRTADEGVSARELTNQRPAVPQVSPRGVDDPGLPAPAPRRAPPAHAPAAIAPPEARQPGMPGMLPLYDMAGRVIGYVQGAAEGVRNWAREGAARATEAPIDPETGEPMRPPGLPYDPAQVAATTPPPAHQMRPGGRTVVESPGPGEADYLPPSRGIFDEGGLLEPMGGGPRVYERMRQIRDNAHRDVRAAGGDPTRSRATDDPGWRERNPEMAAEYDALEQQFALTVAGQAGDAPRPQRPTPAISQALRTEYGPAYPDVRGRITGSHEQALGDASAEMIRDSRYPREMVHPDLRSQTMPRVDDQPPNMAGRQNALVPFDPASAAVGSGAGLTGEDEEFDPWRAAAGMAFGGMAGRRARRPGRTFAFGARPGERLEFNVRVVPLRSLVTSHTDTLAINPAFPSELQPRVRERMASRLQIDRIVNEFDPDQLLIDTHTVDRGPMIVGPDNVVESGNGRSIALRRIARERPEEYARYVEALRDELPRYGLADDALEGIDQPVLVRERATAVDRAAFAAEANVGAQAAMSPIERAVQDAGRLPDESVARIVVRSDESIDAALLAAENADVRRAFMATVPETERPALMQADGSLSAVGLERLKSALLVKTYPGSAGLRLATAFVEATDPGVANVERGLFASLPAMSRAEARIASGELDAGLSIAGDVAAAADVYARLRRARMSIGDYIAQAPLFGERETTPLQDRVLAAFAQNARSPARIRAILDEYAATVEQFAPANQGGMFGDEVASASKDEVFDGVLRRLGVDADAAADEGADLGRAGAGGPLVEGSAAGRLAAPESSLGLAPSRGARSAVDIDLPPRPTGRPARPIARPGVVPEGFAPTGGPPGRLDIQGAPPRDVDPDEVADLARRAAERTMTGPHSEAEHLARNVANGVRRTADRGARRGDPPPAPPDGPDPPPNPPPGWYDWAQAWRYGVGLFGNLSTAMVQALGGATEAATGAPVELIRQAIIRGRPESLPLIIGEAIKSVPAGVRSFGRTAKGEIPETIMAGTDYRPSLAQRYAERGETGRSAVANLVEAPGRIATQAPDAFWYEIFYRTGLAQAAGEEAQKVTSRWNPIESVRVQNELTRNPTPEVIARAHELAQESTYKGDLGYVAGLGERIMRGGPNAPEAHKAAGSLLMPVYHTIARIHENALSVAPGVGMLPLDRMGLAAKGRSLDTKLAQQAVGLALTATALQYAAEGGIRGPGPSNPNEAQALRDLGREPNTVNVGGYWVPTTHFGRFGPVLNAIGAYNDAVLYDQGGEHWSDLTDARKLDKLVKNFGRAFSDYPFAEAASTLIDVFSKPSETFATFLGETGAQFVPGAYRTYATSRDPMTRRPDRGADVPFTQRVADTFRQRSGVGREGLPPAQDILGQDVPNPRQGAAAVFPRVGEDRRNAVIETLVKAGVNVGDPPSELSIPNLRRDLASPPLTTAERRRWDRLRGDALAQLVQPVLDSGAFAAAPAPERVRFLERKRAEAAEYAHRTLRREIGDEALLRRVETETDKERRNQERRVR